MERSSSEGHADGCGGPRGSLQSMVQCTIANPATGPRVRVGGFTMIELMVVLSVVAILLVAAVPSFESAVNSNRLAATANEMIASLQTARMEAMRRNRRAVVCFSANAAAASPACASSNINGWITFIDADRSGGYNGGDTLLRTATFGAPVTVQASAAMGSKLGFRPDGMAHDASNALVDGVIQICIPTRRPTQNLRQINIGSGSRISVATADGAGTCAAP